MCNIHFYMRNIYFYQVSHPVHPKGNQSWIFIGSTDAEVESPVLWPPDMKNWLIWKDPDAGKDWRQEEKGTTEDEMVGWCHRLNWHGFGWTPGVGDGQGSLTLWGHKESDTIERLNWNWFKWKHTQILTTLNWRKGRHYWRYNLSYYAKDNIWDICLLSM